MAPEQLSEDTWKLLEGESVTGRVPPGEYTLVGPQKVRVQEYPNVKMLRIQGDDKTIEVDGLDFAAVVKGKETNK